MLLHALSLTDAAVATGIAGLALSFVSSAVKLGAILARKGR